MTIFRNFVKNIPQSHEFTIEKMLRQLSSYYSLLKLKFVSRVINFFLFNSFSFKKLTIEFQIKKKSKEISYFKFFSNKL